MQTLSNLTIEGLPTTVPQNLPGLFRDCVTELLAHGRLISMFFSPETSTKPDNIDDSNHLMVESGFALSLLDVLGLDHHDVINSNDAE